MSRFFRFQTCLEREADVDDAERRNVFQIERFFAGTHQLLQADANANVEVVLLAQQPRTVHVEAVPEVSPLIRYLRQTDLAAERPALERTSLRIIAVEHVDVGVVDIGALRVELVWGIVKVRATQSDG